MHGDFCALCGFRLVRSDHSEPTAANPLTWERKVRAGEFSARLDRVRLFDFGLLSVLCNDAGPALLDRRWFPA